MESARRRPILESNRTRRIAFVLFMASGQAVAGRRKDVSLGAQVRPFRSPRESNNRSASGEAVLIAAMLAVVGWIVQKPRNLT
jgi:hypothetical protein